MDVVHSCFHVTTDMAMTVALPFTSIKLVTGMVLDGFPFGFQRRLGVLFVCGRRVANHEVRFCSSD